MKDLGLYRVVVPLGIQVLNCTNSFGKALTLARIEALEHAQYLGGLYIRSELRDL